MRKLIYMLSAAAVLSFGTACDDLMNTNPSESVGSEQIFSSASSAMTAMNGIYRAMYVAEWGPAWEHENGGIMAYILASDLMGEDHIQTKSGSGWFYYDYIYGIGSDWTYSQGRQAQCWNFFYTLIANANAIIAQEKNLTDDEDMAKYVIGQAYAMRAYCYLWLVQNFQQCDPELPGVPVYTEPTTIESKGKGRGKVQDVYNRINADIDEAITRLSTTSVAQKHSSHIDQYVAQGIKARALLVQGNYADAEAAAVEAMKHPSAQIVPFNQTSKINDVANDNVMWGIAIQTDQSMSNAGVYAHIDPNAGTTYSDGTRFQISAWLYDTMPETDARRAWWNEYTQEKMVYKDVSLGTGDYILMRMEEMALIAAEAACHQENYADAKRYVAMVASQRDPEYEKDLARYTESNQYQAKTSTNLFTLMDYILFQRRVELWGEVSRAHDLKRLGLGVTRTYEYEMNNHTAPYDLDPGAPELIYAIPLTEFDGNDALDIEVDQNPL